MKPLPTLPFMIALLLLELAGLVGIMAAAAQGRWILMVLFVVVFGLCRHRTNQLGREVEHQYKDRFGG